MYVVQQQLQIYSYYNLISEIWNNSEGTWLSRLLFLNNNFDFTSLYSAFLDYVKNLSGVQG